MKLNIFVLMLAVLLLAGCKNEEPNFTRDITTRFDKVFALHLEDKGYIPDAEMITPADVKNIKYLNVSAPLVRDLSYIGDLTSLAGIEYFSALDTLYCYGNQLTELNLSKNKVLTVLGCGNNKLTSLNII